MLRSRLRIALIILLASTSACGDWPRFSHLPGPSEGYSSQTDPRGLVGIDDWQLETEVEVNDSPTAAQVFSLNRETGIRAVQVSGLLEGIGWSDIADSPMFDGGACNDATFHFTLDEPGSYVGDIDFFLVELANDGLFCARFHTLAQEDYGWDLIAYLVDECGVPIEPLTGSDGSVLGFGLGGAVGGWSYSAVAGDRIAIFASGYTPNSAESVESYHLGLSLLEASSGPITVCPLNPSEVEL